MEKRRKYDPVSKIWAVNMVTEQELGVSKVARDLGLHANVLRQWQILRV